MSGESAVPSPRLFEAIELLENLPGSGPETIALLADGRPRVLTFEKAEVAKAIRALQRAQGIANCYFHVNTPPPHVRSRKTRKEDITHARMLHVDIDSPDGLSALREFPTPPTLVIFSGGGFQGFWFLKEATSDVALAEQMNRGLAALLGGDHCHNVDRLMRLPGTLNVPNAKKRASGRETALAYIVRELTDFNRRYDVQDLGHLASASPPQRQLRAPEQATDELFDAASQGLAISDFTVELIRHGDSTTYPIGSPKAIYRSRSEAVFRVACDLARAGAGVDYIASILVDPRNGISASIREKRHPRAYAEKQALQAHRAVGDDWPDKTKDGKLLPTFANALTALVRLGAQFQYDEFQNRRKVLTEGAPSLTGELSDDVCASLRHEVLVTWEFDPGKENIRDAAHTLCLENTVHPIREYLSELTWDGEPRVASWLTTHLGADDTPLNRAIALCVLVGAVRRVRQPGVKFDTIMVLEGAQGTGKSTAIEILAGDGYFSDQELLTLDPKAQIEALEGKWFYEIGELQGLSRSDIDRVKGFASRNTDRGRAAYARFREDRPRQVVFIGTTNEEQYLKDTTGNRRFWPVKTGNINLDRLKADRDQLFAEAAHLEANGCSITLPRELWTAAATEQEARLLDDPWLEALRDVAGTPGDGLERISSSTALERIGLLVDRQNSASAKRLAPLMRKLGWTGPKQMRTGGTILRGYERPLIRDSGEF